MEFAEGEYPSEEDEENSEKEQIVCSSERRRSNDRHYNGHSRPRETGNRLHRIACHASFIGIVGHQLANDLCAPLLI